MVVKYYNDFLYETINEFFLIIVICKISCFPKNVILFIVLINELFFLLKMFKWKDILYVFFWNRDSKQIQKDFFLAWNQGLHLI